MLIDFLEFYRYKRFIVMLLDEVTGFAEEQLVINTAMPKLLVIAI